MEYYVHSVFAFYRLYMKAKISIIVPVYNVAAYLKRCINSILNQSFNQFELIIIDDGSTDNSLELCRMYESDERVSIYHQENQGLSVARNIGIEKSNSKYIVFVDSDDWINVNYLKVLYENIVEYEADIVQVDFWATRFEHGNLPVENERTIKILTGEEAVNESSNYPGAIKYNIAWNKIYKKSLFDNIRYPKGKIHEDEYTTYKLFLAAKKVVDISDRLYYYFQRDDSITRRESRKKRLDRYEAFEQKIEDLKEKGLFDAEKAVSRGYFFKLYEDLQKCINLQEEYDNILKKYNEVKDIVVSRYGLDIIRPYNSGRSYSFPNTDNVVQMNARIAIYGAGNVGIDYYQQISKIADVVAWVDHRWYYLRRKEVPVDCVDILLVTSFDYVIVAVEKEKIFDEIKATLIKLEIDKERIIWENPIICKKKEKDGN